MMSDWYRKIIILLVDNTAIQDGLTHVDVKDSLSRNKLIFYTTKLFKNYLGNAGIFVIGGT